MKVWYFVLYALYLFFGCFTIAFVLKETNISSATISFIVGGAWGAIVAHDALKRFN